MRALVTTHRLDQRDEPFARVRQARFISQINLCGQKFSRFFVALQLTKQTRLIHRRRHIVVPVIETVLRLPRTLEQRDRPIRFGIVMPQHASEIRAQHMSVGAIVLAPLFKLRDHALIGLRGVGNTPLILEPDTQKVGAGDFIARILAARCPFEQCLRQIGKPLDRASLVKEPA
ncbi:hypothetical protein [Paraburkholderia sp. 31.1]|uniref:hypothetical protein n=1 Tax=Paraburkholderia sp. 31.1 TaxID=2615205 RepID=UPI0016553735|nr:hypothetical protein [Paraburkholderia sp. 31.1]